MHVPLRIILSGGFLFHAVSCVRRRCAAGRDRFGATSGRRRGKHYHAAAQQHAQGQVQGVRVQRERGRVGRVRVRVGFRVGRGAQGGREAQGGGGQH